MIFSIDVGYSFVKYAYSFDGDIVKDKFITAVAPAEGFDPGIGVKSSVVYKSTEYVVGEKALYMAKVLPTRSKDFLENYTPLLLYEALKRKNVSPDVVIFSVSIADFKDKALSIKNACESFEVNGEVFRFDVKVYPQGLGIWQYTGSYSNALILDIGFNTIDVLAVLGGEVVPELSGGYSDMGVCEIASDVAEYISSNITKDYVPELSVIKILADGKFKYMRREYDISDIVNLKKKEYTKRVFDIFSGSQKLKTLLDKVDTLIVAGGGAYFLDEDLKKSYGIITPKDPEYTNVLGFIKLEE